MSRQTGARPAVAGTGLAITGCGVVHSPTHAGFDAVEVFAGELPRHVRRQWLELCGRAFATPFQHPDWLDDWQSHIGNAGNAIPVTVCCYRGGELVALLPLAQYSKWGLRWLGWRASHVNDYCAPVILPETASVLTSDRVLALLARAAEAVGGIGLVYLTKQPTHLGAIPNSFVLPGSQAHHAGVHAIRLGPDWDTYYSAQRSGKSRRRLKTKAVALHKLGPVVFRFARTGREKADMAAHCIDLKARQLQRLGHWHPFRDERVKRLLVAHAEKDLDGRFWAASLDVGQPAAAIAFGFTGPQTWLLYQMAMADGPAAQHSPGIYLLHELMRHCIASGVSRLDLSLGDEPYKFDWCNEHGQLMSSVVAMSPAGHLAAAAIRARSAAYMKIGGNPLAYEFGKQAKAALLNAAARARNLVSIRSR